ncbi:MAG: acyl-CoA dehydrogenase family protein [Actinomycetota bacterium]
MRFALSPEQEAFRDTARAFLAKRVRLRETIELPGAHDAALYKEIAAMGWFGVGVPEEVGGQGLSFVEAALLAEEAGRSLLPGPFLATLIAVEATPTLASLRGALVSGDRVPAVQIPTRGSGLRFVRNRVRGEEPYVACAAVADVLLVIATTPEGEAPFFVRASEATIELVESADLTRPAARVRFDGARVEERLEPAALPGLVDRARVLIAADAVGGASAALDMAVAYAKDRIQFDRPIGSFQAVKHRAAEAWRTLEGARLATWYAAWALANDAPEAHAAALAAKAAAGDAFVRCAADSIQIHGGIGFTWEHDAHLYYRRALADQALLGDATSMRDELAGDVLERA